MPVPLACASSIYLPEKKVLEAGEVLQRRRQHRHSVVANSVAPARYMAHTRISSLPPRLSQPATPCQRCTWVSIDTLATFSCHLITSDTRNHDKIQHILTFTWLFPDIKFCCSISIHVPSLLFSPQAPKHYYRQTPRMPVPRV